MTPIYFQTWVPAASLSVGVYAGFRRSAGSGTLVDIGPPRRSLEAILHGHVVGYPTPASLSYFWGFGSLAGFCLFIQVSTGIFLAMHYAGSATLAFASVEHIMRDIVGGWFLRYLHANGASAFFVVVYLHMLRALLYRSYTYANRTVWLSGLGIFVLMMATAFIGYVLPWGQMSFWGATVITNFFSVVPILGPELVQWIWGGFSVGAPTLSRFFSLHYLLPFAIAALVFLHFFYLHNEGSSNPFALESREVNGSLLPLYPYFLIKDLLGLFLFLYVLSYFLFYAPNALGHSDNYIEANPMVTPEHIVPEWYFLPFYAILRSIPDKALGIAAMGAALGCLGLLTLDSWVLRSGGVGAIVPGTWGEGALRSLGLVKAYVLTVLCFLGIFNLLGFIGARPVEEPYLGAGLMLTLLYFFLLECLTPLGSGVVRFPLRSTFLP